MPLLEWIKTNLPHTKIARSLRDAEEQDFMRKYRQSLMDQQNAQLQQQAQAQGAAQQAWGSFPDQALVTPKVTSPEQLQQNKMDIGQHNWGTADMLASIPQDQRPIWQAYAQTDPVGALQRLGQTQTGRPGEQWREETVSGLPGQRNVGTGKFDPFPQQAQSADGITIRELNVGDNIRYGRFNKQGEFQGYVTEPSGQQIGGPRAARDESGPTGPWAGNSIEAQDSNLLRNGDPSTQEYAIAYARQGAERVLTDGSRIRPDMRPFRQPTFGAYGQQPGPGQPPAPKPGAAAVTPAGVRQAKQMTITMGDLTSNLKQVVEQLRPADRSAYITTGVITPAMAKAQAAFNLWISQLRDPSILNTGVLQPGEMVWIGKMFPDPGSFTGLIQGNSPLFEALGEVDVLLRARKRSFDALDENAAPQGSTQQSGEQAPPDVPPEVWREMTPEQKALWR